MIEEDIDKLRDKLHLLIIEKAEYSVILRVSQELDDFITEFTSEKLSSTTNQNTEAKK